jgi:hypothetical protein
MRPSGCFLTFLKEIDQIEITEKLMKGRDRGKEINIIWQGQKVMVKRSLYVGESKLRLDEGAKGSKISSRS